MSKVKRLLVPLLLLAAMMFGCSPEQPPDPAIQQDVEIQNVTENPEDKALLDKISVTYEEDSYFNGEKQPVTVWVENKSNKVFTGDIHVTFKDKDGKRIGYDLVFVEELSVGQRTYAKTHVTPSEIINMDFRFARGYRFTDDGIGDNGTLDEALTSELTEYMYGNFGGSGRQEFATSWYKTIKEFEVYEDKGNYYAVVIIDTDDEKVINAIVSASSRGLKGVSLSKVIARSEDGQVLLERAN